MTRGAPQGGAVWDGVLGLPHDGLMPPQNSRHAWPSLALSYSRMVFPLSFTATYACPSARLRTKPNARITSCSFTLFCLRHPWKSSLWTNRV